jgi:major membrane immunogen (membrane-anchored lipoprotein)
MKLIITIILAALLLTGCGEKPPSTREVDQCLRREILMQCLATVPKGPEATKYNDWDEVVSECGQQAYRTALRQIAQIKEECRP